MQRQVSLIRTARPRFNLYTTDGLGRDTYISMNNGGFWTKNIKAILFIFTIYFIYLWIFYNI